MEAATAAGGGAAAPGRKGSGLRGREGSAAPGEEGERRSAGSRQRGGAGSRSVVREWGGKEGERCGEGEGGGKRIDRKLLELRSILNSAFRGDGPDMPMPCVGEGNMLSVCAT